MFNTLAIISVVLLSISIIGYVIEIMLSLSIQKDKREIAYLERKEEKKCHSKTG